MKFSHIEVNWKLIFFLGDRNYGWSQFIRWSSRAIQGHPQGNSDGRLLYLCRLFYPVPADRPDLQPSLSLPWLPLHEWAGVLEALCLYRSSGKNRSQNLWFTTRAKLQTRPTSLLTKRIRKMTNSIYLIFYFWNGSHAIPMQRPSY